MKERERTGEGSVAENKILELFRHDTDRFLSGGELSRLLNVSRTAVWKQINALKSLGYEIDGRPSRGYRLVSRPDLMIPAELQLDSGIIGRRIVCFRELESTNTTAFRLADEGAADGTVVIAETQSRGKGRLGRQWESPAGVNLYCSVVVRPAIEPIRAPHFSVLTSVAVARAIEATTPLRADIKWPNDLLINGKKVAGLLNEMSAETEMVKFIILGIGVNINMQIEQFPEGLRQPATSMAIEAARPVDRTLFTRELLCALDGLYSTYMQGGWEIIRNEWVARCPVVGKRVAVSSHDTTITGTVVGIDDIGGLLVQHESGTIERILAGDVRVIG